MECVACLPMQITVAHSDVDHGLTLAPTRRDLATMVLLEAVEPSEKWVEPVSLQILSHN